MAYGEHEGSERTLVHQSPAPTLLPRGGGAGREVGLRRRGERQLLVLDTNVVEALLRSLGRPAGAGEIIPPIIPSSPVEPPQSGAGPASQPTKAEDEG